MSKRKPPIRLSNKRPFNGPLTGADIRANSVDAGSLSDEAGGDGVNNPGGGRPTFLSASPGWAVLEQVAVTHPSAGYVHCNGADHTRINANDFAGTIKLGWSTAAFDVMLDGIRDSDWNVRYVLVLGLWWMAADGVDRDVSFAELRHATQDSSRPVAALAREAIRNLEQIDPQ